MKCGSPLCMLLQVLADVHCCMAAIKYEVSYNYGYSSLLWMLQFYPWKWA